MLSTSLPRDLLDELEVRPDGDDSTDFAADRRRRAERLYDAVGGDRGRLEQLRNRYLARLHRASDDFGATEALRVVELALSWSPRPAAPWPIPARGRKRAVAVS